MIGRKLLSVIFCFPLMYLLKAMDFSKSLGGCGCEVSTLNGMNKVSSFNTMYLKVKMVVMDMSFWL